MKIAFFTLNPTQQNLRGGTRRCISLANGLVERGHDVSIILKWGRSFNPKIPCLAKVISLEEGQDTSWDIVVCHSKIPRKKNFFKCKRLFLFLGGLGRSIPTYRNVFQYYERDDFSIIFQDISRLAAAVTAKWPKEVLNRSTSLRCGIGSNFHGVEREFNSDGKLTVGFFFHGRKQGLPVILQALPKLNETTSNWLPLCFGYKKTPSLNGKVGRYIMAGDVKVKYLYKLSEEELVQTYRKIDIFIAAEPQAGWSHTAAEAMACGSAVVCGWCGTAPFAENKKTALVVNTLKPNQVANAVKLLIENNSLRGQIVQQGLKRTSSLTWLNTAINFEEVIEKLGDFSQFQDYLDRFPSMIEHLGEEYE